MPSLVPNIENRVRKLAKPSNHAQGLQPLFEAISNAFYAIEDRFEAKAGSNGLVRVTIRNLGHNDNIKIDVADNGIGLDHDRFEAFCIIDTDFKRTKGGKGVGRLFWLDAFSDVLVRSSHIADKQLVPRTFRFQLGNEDQIQNQTADVATLLMTEPGVSISFSGLRIKAYQEHFPKRADTFLRYFAAHFIADFLVGAGPKVVVDIDGEITEFPKVISELVEGPAMETGQFETAEFGMLEIRAFACDPRASTGLDGNHQLHLLGNGRTVESRKIDGLLGVTDIKAGDKDGLFFHACVSGEYLNDRVNEGRTAFNLSEKTLKELTRQCVEVVKTELLLDQVEEYKIVRRGRFEHFIARHPIYGFDDTETQLSRVPFNATQPEDFAAGLVKYQIRKDEARQDAMEKVIATLEAVEDVPANFADTVVSAAKNLQDAERLSLAQHVVRRKLVLELMEKLIKRIKIQDGKPDGFHLEKTLHSFIVPMSVQGSDGLTPQSRDHDLWIVDERLAFTRGFASDVRLNKILKDGGNADRPDLLVWDVAYGLGAIDPNDQKGGIDVSEPLRKVMIVEFKRPGRRDYQKAEDQVEQQINKYLLQLQGGEVEAFGRERVRIAQDCIFYCYVVADIIGDLKTQLSGWKTTANRQGRLRMLEGEFQGSIEVIQWSDLVNDAWSRNQASLHAAGLRRR